MIERLEATNFQVHDNFTLELDKQVTSLVGRSDSGKTSLLRLLSWICFNQPRGEAFRTHGKDFVRGKLVVDGHMIVRKKGKKNTYSLDWKTFAAFGTVKVPEEIETLLNLSELNYQDQHSPPFWLSLSPGQVSKELNAIINLGLIDDVLAHVASELRKAKATKEVCKSRLKDARRKRKELQWVKEFDTDLQALELLNKRAEEEESRTSLLRQIVEQREILRQREETLSMTILDAGTVLRIGEQLEQSQEQTERLLNYCTEMEQWQSKATEARESLIHLESDLVEMIGETCPLCQQPISK